MLHGTGILNYIWLKFMGNVRGSVIPAPVSWYKNNQILKISPNYPSTLFLDVFVHGWIVAKHMFLGLFDGPEIKLRWSKQISIEKTCNEPTFPTFHLFAVADPTFDLKVILASFEKAKILGMSWVKTTCFKRGAPTQNGKCFRILSSKHLDVLLVNFYS